MLAMLYRRLNTRTGFVPAGLLAGLMLTQRQLGTGRQP